MEFNEKLQELRLRRNLTQEELAEILYVSRTAVSKWESGRGYPNIDSLKAIAKYFGVTIDDLLSNRELLIVAEEDTREKKNHYRSLVFGLLDICVAMLLFLPIFGQRSESSSQVSSLLTLTDIAPYLKIAYFSIVVSIIINGIVTLTLYSLCKLRFFT